MTFSKLVIWILFAGWAFLCIKAFYNLMLGIGTKRIDEIRLSYKIIEGEFRIYVLKKILVRKIPLGNIQDVFPFKALQKKLNIFLSAEHWEHTWFKPRVAVKTLKKGKPRWLLISPDDVDDFVETMKKKIKTTT